MYKRGLRIFIILIIFSLNISSYLSAQNEIDSLKNLLKTSDSIADIYYQIAYLMHFENLDSSIYYAKKSIKYTKKEDTENITYVSLLLGVTYKDKGKYDSALYFINQAKNNFFSEKYSIGVASCNNDIARIYQEIGDYDKSLSYYFESIKIFEGINDTNNLANVYSNIGELYLEINNFNQALSFFNISEKFYQKLKLKKGQAIVLSDIANVYSKQKKYQQAN